MSANGVLCQVTRAEVIKAVRGYEHVRELLGLDTFKQGSPGHTMFERKFQVNSSSRCRCHTPAHTEALILLQHTKVCLAVLVCLCAGGSALRMSLVYL